MRTFETESGKWTPRPSRSVEGWSKKFGRLVTATVYEDGRSCVWLSVKTDDLSEAVQIARDLVVEGSLALNEIALAESLAGEADE